MALLETLRTTLAAWRDHRQAILREIELAADKPSTRQK
jgi:hypothetical protein